VVSLAHFLEAQSPNPQFEVVSIRPVPRPTPDSVASGAAVIAFDVNEAGVQIRGYQLRLILTRAFRIQPPQLVAPDFANDVFFDIRATLPAGATREQVPEMLQSVLAERFKLAYHRETREYPMNVLTVGKNGIKLARLPDDTPWRLPDGTLLPMKRTRLPDGTLQMAQSGPVESLFALMNSFGGLQLTNDTGLAGIYNWVQAVPPTTPTMTYQEALQDSFKAMIEAAGLRLETRKVPKDTIIVDHLEKMPTEN
jgi:uncharacterized protein (TIGR03435 family)